MRFWLKGVLECFKIATNKIVKLKIYKWGLVKIMLLISTNKIFEIIMDFNKIILKMILISSFGWRDILTKKVWSKTSKIDKSMRFGGYLNLISGWGIWIEGFDSEFFKEGFDSIVWLRLIKLYFLSKFETHYYKF